MAGQPEASRRSRCFALLVPALLHGLYDDIATRQARELGLIFVVFVAVLFFVAYRLAVTTARQDRYMERPAEPWEGM
jgi:hypothetical protein